MPNLTVHQIYFRSDQLKGLDPAFAPYDNGACSHPDQREFYVFQREYLAGHVPDDGHHGYVSWKFGLKTGISGQRFKDFVAANPGYDVYLIHPFPLDLHMGNIWDQGEHFHPHLKHLAQNILNAVGYDIDLDAVPASLRITAACNFWAGNRRFWDAYMDFCLPIYRYVQNDLSESDRKLFYAQADRYDKVSYFSYVFERLFTTFLYKHPEIKSLAYTYSRAELGAKYSPLEVDLVDRMQQVERTCPPDVAEPLKTDRTLVAALHFYYKYRYEVHFRKSSYILWGLVWRHLPGHHRLRRRFTWVDRAVRLAKHKLAATHATGSHLLQDGP